MREKIKPAAELCPQVFVRDFYGRDDDFQLLLWRGAV